MRINSKIKPLVSDLEKTNISSYLVTSSFERLAVIHKFDILWDATYREAKKSRKVIFIGEDSKKVNSKKALILLLNVTFESGSPEVNRILFYQYTHAILLGYIDWMNSLVEMENIFSDLEILNFPDEQLAEIKERYKAKVNEIGSQESEKIEIEKKQEQNKIDFSAIIKTKKDEWIEKISIAKTEEVITDLKAFALETKNNDLIEEIVNQSQRWFRLERKIRDNVLDLDKEQIECNKINKALLKIISTLKNRIK